MTKKLTDNITNIISIARLAPSVHNSQPWQVRLKNDALLISPEPGRRLAQGDPTGRQTFISLGIFTEACVIALEYYGFKTKGIKVSKETIEITTSQGTAGMANDNLVKSLKTRFTDRSIYRKVEITSQQTDKITSSWQSEGVKLSVSTDTEIIDRCASLTAQGLLLALSSPGFRKELTDYLVPSQKTEYGIPLSTLQTGKLQTAVTKQLIASGLSRKHEAETERKRWQSAGALVFVLADGDSIEYWVESGRAYLRASLAIEELGLSQATSAAIVEAMDLHEDIEKMLGTNQRIQCLLRIGRGQSKPKYSGRLSAESLIIT